MAKDVRGLEARPFPSHAVLAQSRLINPERSRLIIVGAGGVGQKVAKLAAEVDFDVWVVDDRRDDCSTERFPNAERLIVGPFEEALRDVAIDSNTYIIIVTRRRNADEQVLRLVAQTSARYIGMIGNLRKIREIFDILLSEGVPKAALQKICAPLGLDIGSKTENEIAISIIAELIAYRNLGTLPDRPRRANHLDDDIAGKE